MRLPGDLFRHLRRILGERQTEHSLPQCADPLCARIFVRVHKGQRLCQRCADAARWAEARIDAESSTIAVPEPQAAQE